MSAVTLDTYQAAGAHQPKTSAVVANTFQITLRYLRAFARQPFYILITLVQPVVWLFLFSQLFKSVTQLPGFGEGGSYIGFLTPGIVAMTALFSNGWSGMAYVTDMDRGVLDRFLVTPASRGALIAGQLVYTALTTLIQTLIILGLGLAGGASFHGGVGIVLVFIVCTMLLGAAFAGYSNGLALLLRTQESLIGAVNFLVLPASFLSSTFMPPSLMPGWIRDVSHYNPVSWTVDVGRQMLSSHVDWGLVGAHLGYLAALALVLGWWSGRAFRSYQRSV